MKRIKALRIVSLPLRAGQTDETGFFTGFGWFRQHHTERRWSKPFRETQLYEFRADEKDPLTWHYKGYLYRTRPVLITDFGTTPPLLHPFIPPTAFMNSCIFHDEICSTGQLLRCPVGAIAAEKWEPFPISREDGDSLLKIMILAEGGSPFVANLYYVGVSLLTKWLRLRGKIK